MKVGFVGLGIMGKPMAMNLLKAGFDVTVWNRTRKKILSLKRAGAKVADSLKVLAESSDTIIIIVNDTPDVEEVIFGTTGLSTGLSSGKILIDMSTINPEAMENFALRLKDFGCEMLDAPVSGGDTGAQKATLTIMVGGKREVYEKALPLFKAMGKNITFCGGYGNGQRVKMLNQILCGLHTIALSEALALAERMGLDVKIVHKVVSSGAAGSWALANYGPRVLQGDLTPGFKLSMQQKDLRIAHEIATKYDAEFEGAELAYRLFTRAKEKGLGDLGAHGLIKLYQEHR